MEVMEDVGLFLIYLSDQFIQLKCVQDVTWSRPCMKCWGYRDAFWKYDS